MRFVIKKSDVVLFVFIILPILDSINGFLVKYSSSTIGPVYHFLFAICFALIACDLYNYKISKQLGNICVAFFASMLLSMLLNNFVIKNYLLDFSRAMKCLTTFIYIISFLVITKKNRVVAKKILNYSSLVIPGMLTIFKFLGLGRNYYSDGQSGFVGYYSSLDELNVILLILLLYTVISFDAKKILSYIRLVLIAICLILVSSKASISILIFVCLYLAGYAFVHMRKFNINLKNIVFFAIALALVVYVVIPIAHKASFAFFSRQQYLYEHKAGDESFMNYFTSGRLDRFGELVLNPLDELFKRNPLTGIVRMVFGNGFASYKCYGFAKDYHFEMDFFDAYYWMGIQGALFYIALYVYVFVKMKRRQILVHKYIVYFITLFVSFFVGHVIFAGVASVYYCLFIAALSNNCLSSNIEEKKDEF